LDTYYLFQIEIKSFSFLISHKNYRYLNIFIRRKSIPN